MANPQKENGYTAIANELIEKLSSIDITPSNMRVLFAILRKTYGFNRKSDAISLSQFKKLTNLSVRTIIRATQDLEAKKMIHVDRLMDDGAKVTNVYTFVKDYEKWVVTHVSPQTKERREKGKKRQEKWRGSDTPVTTEKGSDTLTEVVTAGVTRGSDTQQPKVVTVGVTYKRQKQYKRKSPKSPTSDDKIKLVKFTPKDVEVVEMFSGLIKVNFEGWKMKGNPDTWAEDINKLHRIDGFTYEQIEYMIKWVQKDSFWSKNILSASKLREKFNDLIPKVKALKNNSKANYVL